MTCMKVTVKLFRASGYQLVGTRSEEYISAKEVAKNDMMEEGCRAGIWSSNDNAGAHANIGRRETQA